ncbi:MAG: hypothetical protein ABWZ91_04675 [Nocardioides sp.]
MTEERPTALSRGTVLAGVRRTVIILVVFAAVGVLAGVVWEWLWDAPVGFAYGHKWLPDLPAARAEFSSTGWYVVVAAAAGLLTAAAVAMVFDRWEVLTLVAVFAGAALASWVMLQVGEALGPPDAQAAAATADDGTRIPANLTVAGKSPFVAFPASALVAMIVVFFAFTRRHAKDG